jgi:hypothetical protein
MPIFTINQGKQWIKNSPNPIAKIMFKKHKVLFLFELPAPRFLMQFFYHSYTFLRALIYTVAYLMLVAH